MGRYWKYTLVAVLAFLVGSATIIMADDIESFVISNEAGTRTVGVTEEGKLMVDAMGQVAVTNLPEVQTVEGNLTVSVDNFPNGSNVPRLILVADNLTLPPQEDSPANVVATPFFNTHDCGSLSVMVAHDQPFPLGVGLILSADGTGNHGLLSMSDRIGSDGRSFLPNPNLNSPFVAVQFTNPGNVVAVIDKAWLNCAK